MSAANEGDKKSAKSAQRPASEAREKARSSKYGPHETGTPAGQAHQGGSPSQVFGENVKKNWGRLTGWGQQSPKAADDIKLSKGEVGISKGLKSLLAYGGWKRHFIDKLCPEGWVSLADVMAELKVPRKVAHKIVHCPGGEKQRFHWYEPTDPGQVARRFLGAISPRF